MVLPPLWRDAGKNPRCRSLLVAIAGIAARRQQFGVLAGFQVQLLNGLEAPSRCRPRSQRRSKSYRAAVSCDSPASSFGVGPVRW